MKKIKKYATMTETAAKIVYANSKREAAEKLNVPVKEVYLYN